LYGEAPPASTDADKRDDVWLAGLGEAIEGG
jgi:hypothetical protein